MNAIFTISPYYDNTTRSWMFSDTSRGLLREPFVAGVPAMLDSLTSTIPNARDGFRLLFSPNPFPNYHRKLTRVKEEFNGVWYRDDSTDLTGWFCPAFWSFFPTAPEAIYVRAESF